MRVGTSLTEDREVVVVVVVVVGGYMPKQLRALWGKARAKNLRRVLKSLALLHTYCCVVLFFYNYSTFLSPSLFVFLTSLSLSLASLPLSIPWCSYVAHHVWSSLLAQSNIPAEATPRMALGGKLHSPSTILPLMSSSETYATSPDTIVLPCQERGKGDAVSVCLLK